MGSPVRTQFNGGWVTARDRGDLEPGELQTATGMHYKPGDPARAHKIGGRSSFGDTGSSAKVVGLYLAQFDSGGTDLLLSLSGNVLRKATPGASGSWSTISGEFTTAATAMSGAHVNNRHYLCNGQDLNVVLKSDGTTRRMGMNPPLEAPTASVSTATQVLTKPTPQTANNYGAGVEGWLQLAKSVDTGSDYVSTFGYVTIGKADNYSSAKEQDWFFGGITTTAHRLEVVYRLTTGSVGNNPGVNVGSGGSQGGRFRTQVIIKYTLTGGAPYTDLVNAIYETSMPDAITVQVPLANATYAGNAIQVRASAQLLTKGDGHSLRIADVRIATGGAASNITTTTNAGLRYLVTEYDANDHHESANSPPSLDVALVANNLVTLTLPTAIQNSRATHWRIYRTPDGAVESTTLSKDVPLNQFGRIAEIPIGQGTWYDNFDQPYNVQAAFILALVPMSSGVGQIYVAFDAKPPNCRQFFVHRGRLIGITGDRALAYSEPAFPESWPSVNSDENFPLQEGDRLICGRSVGDTIIVFCGTTVVTMLDVASWTDGQFRSTVKQTLRGAPGIVGQDAACVFVTAGGAPMAAWVSYQGIYVTDGHTCERISDDRAWASDVTGANLSSAVLHWDRDRQCIVFAYDATAAGTNTRWALIHMAPEHRKANGQPKWTGPHYGLIASMASGMVSGTHRLWSGHTTNGIVYLENNGTTDASAAYSSTQVPLIVTTARLYGDSLGQALSWRDWAVYKANLRHTAAGGSETVSVAWTTGRDSSGVTQSVTKTPSIVSQRGDEFYVGLGGEWHEITLTHTGSASWAVLDMRMDAQAMGRSGRVA